MENIIHRQLIIAVECNQESIILELLNEIELNENKIANIRNREGIPILLLAVINGLSIDVIDAFIKAGASIFTRDRRTNNTLLHVVRDVFLGKYLISLGLDVNAYNNYHMTPLHFVVRSDCDSELALELIKRGANIHEADHMGETILMTCVRRSDKPDFVKTLITLGSEVGTAGRFQRTALAIAVEMGRNIKTIKVLIEAGSDIFFIDRSENNTLLHMVQNVVTAKYLISLGLDVNAYNKSKLTPLHSLITRHNGFNLELCMELIKNGAIVNTVCCNGNSLLLSTINMHPHINDPIFVKTLIASGADINYCNQNKKSPLFLSVENGLNIQIIKALVEAGADIFCRRDDRNTLLHIAPNTSIASYLISLGLDVNALNNRGQTPLHLIMKRAKNLPMPKENISSMMRTLISAGANVHYRDKDNNTLLHYVVFPDMCKELITLGLDVNYTNIHGKSPITKLLNHMQFDDDLSDDDDVSDDVLDTLLLLFQQYRFNSMINTDQTIYNSIIRYMQQYADTCCKMSYIFREIIEALIEAGANIFCKSDEGDTLLHVAPDTTVIKYLISLGLDVNALNNHHLSPLHSILILAWERSYSKENVLSIMRELINAGANIRFLDIHRNNLLHYVVYPDICKDLITLGLDVDEINDNANTPIHTFLNRYHNSCDDVDMCRLLFQHHRMNSMVTTGESFSEIIMRYMHRSRDIKSIKAEIIRLILLKVRIFTDVEDILGWYNNFDEIVLTVDVFLNFDLRKKLTIPKNYVDKHFQKCLAEVKKMKEHHILYGMSLYDFVNEYSQPLPIKKLNFVTSNSYPIYFELLIKQKIKECEKRRRLLKLADNHIHIFSKYDERIMLKDYVLRIITNYISNQDLTNFIKASFKTS